MATTTNNVTRGVAIETAALFIRAHEDAWVEFGASVDMADVVKSLETQASKMRTRAAKPRSTPTKEQIVNQQLADNTHAWELLSDGGYKKIKREAGVAAMDSQSHIKRVLNLLKR